MHLFLLQPSTVLAALVNEPGTITYPLDEVAFDGVTTGAFGDVSAGLTVLFGSSAGADDYGRQRCRLNAADGILYIGRSSKGTHDGEVTIVDNAYITVIGLRQVWAKIPFLDTDGTQYKDSDLEYTDQNEEPPPVANLGPGFAATIDGDDIITVKFFGTSSFATADGATISSYLWTVGDGTITVGSDTDDQITATFPAGFRYVSLTVTDSNGKSHTAYTPVFARDPASDITIPSFQIARHRITAQGQELEIRLKEDALASTYPDGTLVMIWDEEPDEATDRDHMVFIGFHDDDPANIDAQVTGLVREVTLSCIDVGGRMRRLPGFSQIIESDSAPDNWSQMLAPNMDKYLHYLLHWHSTALEVADWTWTGTESNFPFKVLSSEGSNLYEQVNRRATALVPPYTFTCDRLGRLFTVVDPMLQDTGDRTSTIYATLFASDYSNIRYTYQRPPRVHWLRSNAIIASATEVLTAFSIAPGDTPGQGEGAQDDNENLAQSQDDLNSVTGHRYARLNAPLGRLSITLAEGDDLGIEPAALAWVNLHIPAGVAAQRGLVLTNARGLVHEMNIRYSHERTGTVKTVELVWERETSGEVASTVEIEPAEPVDPDDSWIPPDSDWSPPVFGDDEIYYPPVKGYVLWDGAHIMRTWDVLAASPTWALIDTGVTGNIRDIQYVQTGPSTVGAWLMTSTAIHWCDDILATSPSWDDVLTITTVRAAESVPTTGDSHFKCMAHYPSQPGHLCVATGPLAAGNTNTDYDHAYFWVTTDYGANWTQVDMPWTFEDIAGIRGYCYTGQFAMAAFHTPPGTLYCVRSAPTFGSGRNVYVFRSGNLGLSWQQTTDLNLIVKLPVPNSSDAIDFSVMHPFPSSTSAAYAVGGAITDLHSLFLSEDNFTDTDNATLRAESGDPAGYDGIARLWRPNKRTFDNDHIIAWFRNDADNEYHLLQSVDKGQNWTLLYDSGLTAGNVPGTGLATNISTSQHNTPNGWPDDDDIWFLVRAVVSGGSITNVIMSTEDNFATAPVSRVGNLASILPGGATGWTSGSAGGFALPKVGINS